ncbi:hypothetical protein [Ruegeria arenilitoris]|uniref:hypothetical protein n=1 Tax=Ruegeria arenilitoris TaxID=1173585 RepID=UPI00147CC8B5|nr:hypothetical protein [Ruegeria arenilitoris]
MGKAKITLLSAFAFAIIGTASYAVDEPPTCESDCEPPSSEGGNPGNAKPVGNSPWDGITGNSANNGGGPPASTMDGQRPDTPYDQPGGNGTGPSGANDR